jgi:peptidoglycan-N-acetylglucosamine deacetylase
MRGSSPAGLLRVIGGLSLGIAALCGAASLAAAQQPAAQQGVAQKGAAQPKVCAGNPDALGLSRTVEIDTTGGPAFGFEQYKAHDFLAQKEVVLTFDDGPQKIHTELVLAALAQHCTKATFFSIGKMALGYPEIIRDVIKQGHTVGSHTWSHADLRTKKTGAAAIDEIERGISSVKRAVGGPVAPFFRFPFLRDSADTLSHLRGRNIAVFSADVDSFDFKFRNPDQTVKSVMDKLDKKGKGIILMHDIQPTTAKAVPLLLAALKAKGYKVVHLKAKGTVATLPEFDAVIEKDVKGLPSAGSERATSSVVKTVD